MFRKERVFMMRLTRQILALSLGIFIANVSAFGGERAEMKRLKPVFAKLDKQGFSGVLGMYTNGVYIYHDFGESKKDGVKPEHTQVDINSITKTVTGVMMLKLMEQGKVQAEETLSDIFPNVPKDKSSITVHQLLTHSAGIVDGVGNDSEVLSKNSFLERVFQSKLINTPGTLYEYSNAGMGIAAAVIEERSGKDYEQFLREDILAGSGIESTGYESVYDKSRDLKTKRGKSIDEASWGNPKAYWNLVGNGGMISTPEDFLQFIKLYMDGKLVSKEWVTLGTTPHIKEQKEAISFYGYGLVVQESSRVGPYYWHDGGNGVYGAQWQYFTDTGEIHFTAGVDDTASRAIGLLRNAYAKD
jgi:CubicO group peptidase (beta-lactamase class C family)